MMVLGFSIQCVNPPSSMYIPPSILIIVKKKFLQPLIQAETKWKCLNSLILSMCISKWNDNVDGDGDGEPRASDRAKKRQPLQVNTWGLGDWVFVYGRLRTIYGDESIARVFVPDGRKKMQSKSTSWKYSTRLWRICTRFMDWIMDSDRKRRAHTHIALTKQPAYYLWCFSWLI